MAAQSKTYKPLRAPRGSGLRTKGWSQEGALRMMMNNLDPDVGENPRELIVYGGTGKAARNWDCFRAIVDSLLDTVCRALSEGKHLEIRGFGTFKVRERRARRARNPRSGDEVMVPAKLVPVFKPSKELKAMVLESVETPEPVAT